MGKSLPGRAVEVMHIHNDPVQIGKAQFRHGQPDGKRVPASAACARRGPYVFMPFEAR